LTVDAGKRVRAQEVARALGTLFVETRVPVIALAPDGRFVSANPAAIECYGYSLDEFLQMRIHDLVAPGYAFVDRDLSIAVQDADAVLSRRPHQRKDGSVLWVAPTASLVDVAGEQLIVSVLKDVTALLEHAEQMWQAASERLTDGIALLDRDLRVVRCNTALCALLRRDHTDMVGRTCRDIFPLCAASKPCPHEVALVEQRRQVLELQGRISGRPLHIEVIPAPTTNRDFAIVHITHDLSEERAVRSQLVTADRLATIGRLAAGVAHEVNNPAAFVTVNLGVLRDRFVAGAAHSADVLAMLDESLDGMHRIREIVRDLKGLVRERSRDRVDLSLLVAGVVRMAAHEARGRARIEKQLGPAIYANVRGARVAQVVLNLIVNAAQAIPPGNPAGNRITVRTWCEGDRAKIEVSDTGSGVAQEFGARIFEPFFTTREDSGGTGLGLWLAREIVREEGGTIDFTNLPSGGARFVVELAAMEPIAPSAAAEP
jgi:PAS domain S-box-containing protein